MSEVYYVERDGNGAVVAIYGMPQPGITDPEPLPDTDPEVAAILNPRTAAGAADAHVASASARPRPS